MYTEFGFNRFNDKKVHINAGAHHGVAHYGERTSPGQVVFKYTLAIGSSKMSLRNAFDASVLHPLQSVVNGEVDGNNENEEKKATKIDYVAS